MKIAILAIFIFLIILPILLLPDIDYPWPEKVGGKTLEQLEAFQNEYLSQSEILSYLAQILVASFYCNFITPMLFDYFNLSSGYIPHHHTTKEAFSIRQELDELDKNKIGINLEELTLK